MAMCCATGLFGRESAENAEMIHDYRCTFVESVLHFPARIPRIPRVIIQRKVSTSFPHALQVQHEEVDTQEIVPVVVTVPNGATAKSKKNNTGKVVAAAGLAIGATVVPWLIRMSKGKR